jgi:raffinose/stachyose/melibiose transport system substrate-binding protein
MGICKRYVSLVLIVFMAMSLTLVGCTQNNEASGQNTTTVTDQTGKTETNDNDASVENDNSASAEKVKLRIFTRMSGASPTVDWFKSALEDFSKEYPNIEIQDDSVSQEAAFNNKFKTDLATGNLPNIFSLSGIASLVKYAENGALMDVTEIINDKDWSDGFIDGAFEYWNFESYGVNGYYAVPDRVSPELVVYNKDLFAKAGITKVPETMDELYDAIDKLNAIEVTPISCGGKDTWRVGHFHNQVLYKWCGIEKAKALGARTAKWTDPDVVESLNVLKNLKDKGAFMKNFEGVDYETEKKLFLSEKAAMIVNGSWFIGECNSSEIKDKLGTFAFPYFKEKPENQGSYVIYPQSYQLKGNVTGAEKEAQIALIKFLTGKEAQQKLATNVQQMVARKDVSTDGPEFTEIFRGYAAYVKNAKASGGDSFDYDQLSSMQDRTRNSLVGMLLGNTPEAAAKEIQDEIDKNK